MNWNVISFLVLNELRLRLRRRSTMAALLAVVAISWIMIPDPQSGRALMSIEGAQVVYTSTTLALGSAVCAGLLLGLGGFYLVRGRIAEDIRSGIGGVIAATNTGSFELIVSRWVGSVAYLALMVVLFAATILVLHLMRGSGPVEPWVYLRTYSFLLLPLILWISACAILFDSIAALIGKLGDVVFFMLWVLSLLVFAAVNDAGQPVSPWMVFDLGGLALTDLSLKLHFHLANFKFGSAFDASLPALTLPGMLWTREMIVFRFATAALAGMLVVVAALSFHRFSPDRIKVAQTRARRSTLTMVNGWMRPVSRLVQPLFRLSAALPPPLGQVCADVALTLAGSPLAVIILMLIVGASCVVPGAVLPIVLQGAVLCWGLIVADLSTRDHQAGLEEMSGSVPGGITRLYLRHFGATAMLGLLFMGAIGLRFAIDDPLRSAVLFSGILSLSALATCFGHLSRTPSMYTALFLFWIYVAANVRVVAIVDVVGFNGVATRSSMALHLAMGALGLLIGYLYRARARR